MYTNCTSTSNLCFTIDFLAAGSYIAALSLPCLTMADEISCVSHALQSPDLMQYSTLQRSSSTWHCLGSNQTQTQPESSQLTSMRTGHFLLV
jgi:hypothetical protein